MDFDDCFRLKMAWRVKYARSTQNLQFKTTVLVLTSSFCPFRLLSPFISPFLFSPSFLFSSSLSYERRPTAFDVPTDPPFGYATGLLSLTVKIRTADP